ncbi:uncharacterized protein LOC131161558 [Malania oleifera]|uniref:uncharacterized protein LOC131161558 n=1 Tax=Malania oleifera TaxID=397392 RepID=UPI0025ADA058|nr:uncharacterized protein LOC131161558 [Malania oleifera]
MRNRGNQSRFMRIITVPIRVLGKAKDLYVRSLTSCADRVGSGAAAGCSSGGMYTLPKSFSVSSSRSSDSGDDFRELVRAASAKRLSNRIEMDLYLQQQIRKPPATGSKGVPRSSSVAMGRIDEDEPCDFEEGSVHAKNNLMYPRSKSYAVAEQKSDLL